MALRVLGERPVRLYQEDSDAAAPPPCKHKFVRFSNPMMVACLWCEMELPHWRMVLGLDRCSLPDSRFPGINQTLRVPCEEHGEHVLEGIKVEMR